VLKQGNCNQPAHLKTRPVSPRLAQPGSAQNSLVLGGPEGPGSSLSSSLCSVSLRPAVLAQLASSTGRHDGNVSCGGCTIRHARQQCASTCASTTDSPWLGSTPLSNHAVCTKNLSCGNTFDTVGMVHKSRPDYSRRHIEGLEFVANRPLADSPPAAVTFSWSRLGRSDFPCNTTADAQPRMTIAMDESWQEYAGKHL
jgi:hypothetical protein